MSGVVAKSGGTPNCDADAVRLSMEWAEQADIFIPSAPGKLPGWSEEAEKQALYGVIPESKVTKMLLAARQAYLSTGEVPDVLTDMVTARYAAIVDGLGGSAMPGRWLDKIPSKIEGAAYIGEAVASILGERLQHDIYVGQGFTSLDPGRAPHDLGSDREAWRGWLSPLYRPGNRYVLPGNTTRVGGQLTDFSTGGCDTSGGHAADAIRADRNLNLTDGGAKSADPRLIGKDRVLDIGHMLYEEGRELGRNGTGLVHPAAMVPLMLGNITTEVRSTFDRNAPFTVLDNDVERAESRAGRIIALSLMNNVVVHRVHEPGMAEAVGRLEAFDHALAAQGDAAIDSQGDGVDSQKYFVSSSDADLAADALRQATHNGTVEAGDKTSFITLVGYRLDRRIIDSIFNLAFNSGIRGKFWQQECRSLTPGRHSLRIGVEPERAQDILAAIHHSAIELPNFR